MESGAIPLVKVMLQASMPGRKNSPPRLDSAHISCRLAAALTSAALGTNADIGDLLREHAGAGLL
jgi:hypothetical protein